MHVKPFAVLDIASDILNSLESLLRYFSIILVLFSRLGTKLLKLLIIQKDFLSGMFFSRFWLVFTFVRQNIFTFSSLSFEYFERDDCVDYKSLERLALSHKSILFIRVIVMYCRRKVCVVDLDESAHSNLFKLLFAHLCNVGILSADYVVET